MPGAVKLGEIASTLRSKNAGPYQLTFDVFFKESEDFNRVKASGAITKRSIAQMYRISEREVLHLVWHDLAKGVKITIVRRVVSGGPGERDLYGCQQHAPLLDLEVQ